MFQLSIFSLCTLLFSEIQSSVPCFNFLSFPYVLYYFQKFNHQFHVSTFYLFLMYFTIFRNSIISSMFQLSIFSLCTLLFSEIQSSVPCFNFLSFPYVLYYFQKFNHQFHVSTFYLSLMYLTIFKNSIISSMIQLFIFSLCTLLFS